MSQQMLTVTQLNEYLRMLMESNPVLSCVYVRGEISNFTNHYKTGHFYFSLKDEGALVRAVMFRGNAQRLRFLPENGMKVILRGRVSVFVRDGQYQIYVEDLHPDGVGALYLAYEQLRQRLEAGGLFDAARKRALPPYPARIGIVTSPTGAAVRDMLDILGRRFPHAELFLYPALVQGPDAPESLMRGLACFAGELPVDLIIIGRGGGSAEDLFAFNHEGLARAVAASPVPVISAVGHETDFTICDFVADLRAPTPSAAAELAVPDQNELRRYLGAAAQRLRSEMARSLTERRRTVSALAGAEALRSPRYYVEERQMCVAHLEQRLQAAEREALGGARADFSALCAKLGALSPLSVLSRGYTAVFDGSGAPVTAAAQLSVGERIKIRFADKSVDAAVLGVQEGEHYEQ